MTFLDDYQILILNDKKYDIIKNSWINNNQILSLSEMKNNICYINNNNIEISINYKNKQLVKFNINSEIELIKKDFSPVPKSPRIKILMPLEKII